MTREEQDTPDAEAQPELPLRFPASGDVPLLPARMLNEFAYCPRLAYLEWLQGEWEDSTDTVEGRATHRRTDKPQGSLPEADELCGTERLHVRWVTLSDTELGLIGTLDLIESDGSIVAPVDYKRGKRPHIERQAYLPERVQIGAQILLLRANGYTVEHGVIYFAGSRERVTVTFDADLAHETEQTIHGLRLMAASGHIPPPLEDSPKCACGVL